MAGEATQPKPSPEEVIERLQRAFPLAFTDPPKPLQTGVHKLIRADPPPLLDGVNNTTLSKSIGRWVRQDAYLKAIRSREPRCDLEGRPVAEITDEDVQEATRILRHRERRRYHFRKKRTRSKAQPRTLSNHGRPP